MVKYTLHFLILIMPLFAGAQETTRPKLVVGIVVDQMRWDYLQRFSARYAADGGFKRMMNNGYNCQNTQIPYVPTLTACGHAGIYTGSVPSIHGITGNDWYDNELQDYVYCTSDKNVEPIGTLSPAGRMSPRNMLTSTICDELKLATNFKSKTVGIALKDRGAILTVGHNADAAWWYDAAAGNWITSSHYMKAMPPWVVAFNNQKLVDKFYRQNWNTLYPIATYEQSAPANYNSAGEATRRSFPYALSTYAGVNYSQITATPYGNTLTTEFAKANIENEKLGEDTITDFLAVSYSSPDLIGHAYGPNSIEIEDCFLRLDAELGGFLDYLDKKIGKGQYLVFLSADHGVAHAPGFLKENKMPAGNLNMKEVVSAMNTSLQKEFKEDNIVLNIFNNQVVLNGKLFDSYTRQNRTRIKEWVLKYLNKQDFVQHAFALDDLKNATINETQKKMISNSYYPKRSGHISLIINPQWIIGYNEGGSTHGAWNPYDARIPLLWYGWKIKPGVTSREIYMTDIAPTLAALLRIQVPNGSVGKVITEITR